MLKLGAVGLGVLFLGACAYGPHSAASKLPDGRIVHFTDYTSHGEGTQIKTVDSFLCAKEDAEAPVVCNPFRHTSASGNSVTVSLFNGAGTALVVGAASVGAAHELRPAQNSTSLVGTTTQVGGGAESGSTAQGGTAQSESLSRAAQEQSTQSAATAYSKQRQGQGQLQGQEQTATGGNANAGASVNQPQESKSRHGRHRR